MTLKEIKKIKWCGKNETFRIDESLYVEITKTKKVYKIILKKDNKLIKATIGDIEQVNFNEAKNIVKELKVKTDGKGFEESRKIIREKLAKKQSKKDKEAIAKTLKENEKFLLKNLIGEFIETRNRQSKNRIQNYIIPLLGDKDVRRITEQDLIRFFKKVKEMDVNPQQTTFKTNKMATIKRLKNELSVFYTYLHFTHGVNNNPLTYLTLKNLEKVLGEKYKVKHFKAITELDEIKDFYEKLVDLKTKEETGDRRRISIYTKLGLEFLLLTALRNGTLRQMTWDMVNWKKETIEIPGDITKTGIDYTLPLTKRLKEILNELKDVEKGNPKGYIFKGDNGTLMSNNTLNQQIKKLTNGKSTAHGIRTSFSTIMKEHGHDVYIVEKILMHEPDTKVAKAYTRGKFEKLKKKTLEDWFNLIKPTQFDISNGPKTRIVFDF